MSSKGICITLASGFAGGVSVGSAGDGGMCARLVYTAANVDSSRIACAFDSAVSSGSARTRWSGNRIAKKSKVSC